MYTIPLPQILGSLAPAILLSPQTSNQLLSPVQFLGAEVNVGLQILLLLLHSLKLIIESLQLVWEERKEAIMYML